MQDFEEVVFGHAQQRLARLQSELPSGALEKLARDVVHHLSSRAKLPHGSDLSHPDARDIDMLCGALIHADADRAREMMVRLQKKGVSLDLLYARYLAPAAVRLGEMWDRDELGFYGVTLGVGRIYDLVRLLRDRLPEPRITRTDPVVFASVPGDQHGIGVEMAAELFRQHGWDVRLLVNTTHEQIIAEIERVSCLVLGLSSGSRATAEALARIVTAVRVAHPHLFIIIAGRIVLEEPDLVALMEPDGSVTTVDEALETMERLTGEPRPRR